MNVFPEYECVVSDCDGMLDEVDVNNLKEFAKPSYYSSLKEISRQKL